MSKKSNKKTAKLKKSSETIYFPFYLKKKELHTLHYMFQTRQSLNVSEEKIIQEDIAEAEQSIKKTKSNKSKWWNVAFLAINIGIILFIFLTQNNGELVGIGELLSTKTKWIWLILAVVMIFLTVFTNSFKYYDLIYKATGRRRKYLSYKVTALGRYYDAITPLSTGGEPFQVYYLNRRSIRGELATSIPMVVNIFWQITFVIISIAVLIANAVTPITSNPLITTAAWIGMAFNGLLIIFVVLFSVSKKVGPRLTIWILKLLYKLHFIKNYQHAFRKVVRFVSNYQRSMRYFTSHFRTLVLQLILAFVNIICNYLIVFFIYLAFQPNVTMTFWDMFLRLVMCELASTIMPLPGGSGAAEYSFGSLFQSWFPSDVFLWALLIWRIFTYYIYIIQGLLVTLYDYFIGNRKAKRLDESGYFKTRTILSRESEFDQIQDDSLKAQNEVYNDDLEQSSEQNTMQSKRKKKLNQKEKEPDTIIKIEPATVTPTEPKSKPKIFK